MIKRIIFISGGFSFVKIAGIICEYNPFHNGHKYQIEMLKKEYDAVVCLMSGSFVQRGDVAIFDKWTRAKAALLSGCDLVIELPAVYALSSAQGFAKGGVDILSATGVIDALSFGSECGDIDALINASDILSNETPDISEKIKNYLKNGISFPSAREKAYNGIISSELLSNPNNILALEYITELKKLNSKIIPITHKRSDNGYHSTDTKDHFASATKIRSMISNNEDFSEYVPYNYSKCSTYNLDKLTDLFRYLLLTNGRSAFDGICDIEDGLDNRFLQNINKNSISEIINCVKTKRYPRTRLQRIVCRMLLGIKSDFIKPEYIRILGMTHKGMEILSEMRKKSAYPLVNKVADFKEKSISYDILATDLSSMCTESNTIYGKDYLTSPVII